MNFGIIALAALLPLIIGFAWYHPMAFGKAWMVAAGVTEEGRPSGGRMAFIFIMTYVLSFLAGLAIQSIVIHQMHLFSILIDEPGFRDKDGNIIPTSEIGMLYTNFMAKFGNNFRTFKHGALHGTLIALFFVMPIMAINAMFERKGFKYIAINTGYWIVSLALMGGLVCAFP
jgi:hypothetical protein